MIHRFKDICTKHNIESTKADLADRMLTYKYVYTFHYSMHKCKYTQKKIRVLSASSVKKGNNINEMLDSQLLTSFESLAQKK